MYDNYIRTASECMCVGQDFSDTGVRVGTLPVCSEALSFLYHMFQGTWMVTKSEAALTGARDKFYFT